MTTEFDVPSRQAEGRPAVANLQHYVHACHQLGYQHPDLTLHAAQLTDEYGREDGMNLSALHDDWVALEDVARAAQEALAVQDRQLAAFSVAWQGVGAEVSRDFLRRHCEASAAAEALVRAARDSLGALRESLWRSVDAKVDAVVEIEARVQAQRTDWLAAAATVTTGAGDRAVAAEMVDHAVKPFVDSGVRCDLLISLRTAMTSLTEAYQRAAAEVAAEQWPAFDLPGDFGSESVVAQPSSVMPIVPAGWNPAPSVTPEAPAAAPFPPAPLAAGPVPSPGGMATGTTEFGSGLAGVGRHFADMLSGLLGSVDNVVPDSAEMDVPDIEDPPGLDEETEADNEDAKAEEGDAEVEEGPVEEDPDDEEAEVEADPAEEVGDEPVEAAEGSAPVPTPAPPPAEPLPVEPLPVEPLPVEPPPPAAPPAGPVVVEQTPCEIAAEELPQVGEPPGVSEPGAG